VVRAVGVEPTQAEALRIFMPAAAFAVRARRSCAPARGLWSGLSLHRLPVLRGLGAARLVSTPSRRKFPSRLGSGLPLQVSPNLGSSASPVSRRALKFSLSPLRMPFRHARVAVRLQLPMIKQPAGIYTYVSDFGRAASERWADFCVFFGLMMLIAAASRFVLMCAA